MKPTYTDLVNAVNAYLDCSGTTTPETTLLRIVTALQLADKELEITALRAALADAHEALAVAHNANAMLERLVDKLNNSLIRAGITTRQEHALACQYRRRAIAINAHRRELAALLCTHNEYEAYTD